MASVSEAQPKQRRRFTIGARRRRGKETSERAAHDAIALSVSVESVRDSLGRKAVTAAHFAHALCQLHSDYYEGKLERAAPELARLRARDERTAGAWTREVRALFVPSVARLDTASMLLGLALLDGRVFSVFHGSGVVDALLADLVDETPGVDAAEETASSARGKAAAAHESSAEPPSADRANQEKQQRQQRHQQQQEQQQQ